MSLQAHHVRNLILILRRANAYYACVAACNRSSFQPTLHARKRANKLGLTINVPKAIACPQNQVSNIPLPIIEIVTPLQPPLPSPPPSPLLICTSPNGTASFLSPIALTASPLTYPSRWSAYDDDDSMDQVEYWESLADTEDFMNLDQDYPQSASQRSVSSTPAYTTFPPSSDPDSSSTSATSSSGPSTPSSGVESSSFLIRIKRKPTQDRSDDMGQKRPRVRYGCIVRQTERGRVICISPRH